MSEGVPNPWKTLSSKRIYSNPWITLREDQVIKPNGTPGIYGVVTPRIATGVVALDKNLNVVLVGQYRYTVNEYSWEIPEGGAEKDESPIAAIKRELLEEAHLKASIWEPLSGGEIHLSNCFTDERAFLFLARDLQEVPVDEIHSGDDTEVLQLKKIPLKEALSMAQKGEIKDALTIIGLHLTVAKLGGLS
jgi:8-oxo-dGTP pyrophosphatase MutT (NUDIX family)